MTRASVHCRKSTEQHIADEARSVARRRLTGDQVAELIEAADARKGMEAE